MYKQIILFTVFLFCQQINSQNNAYNIPVYSKKKEVGSLNTDTKLIDCNDCYVLDSVFVYNKLLIIKTEADLIGSSENENQFARLYSVEYKNEGEVFKIMINNMMNSEANTLSIKKIKDKLFIIKQFSHVNSIASIKIEKNDYEGYPSTFICSQNTVKEIVNDTLDFKNLFVFNESKECFQCPNKYSIKECLDIKRKKGKFIWNND